MRKLSTLVGLTLLALAGTARAGEAAPAADKAAPAEEKAAPAADKAAPTEDKAEATASKPEAAEAAPAEGNVAATPVPPQPAGPRKLEVGLSFLPMAIGKYTYELTGEPEAVDASFAYGVGLSGTYEVLPGLLVGLAPQLTFNVRPKTEEKAAKQLDLLVRVAYVYRLPAGMSIYAEVLPGYSMILLQKGAAPKGMVVAFGAGTTMDLTDRYFASLGVGYQLGFHNQSLGASTAQNRTRYVRVALGGGMRF